VLNDAVVLLLFLTSRSGLFAASLALLGPVFGFIGQRTDMSVFCAEFQELHKPSSRIITDVGD
jgi:hypothetical protein